MANDNGTCPAHEEFRATILTAIGGIREVLQTELRALRDDLSRRMDESREDRAGLHDRVTEVSGHIERLAGRMNGMHQRTEDAQPHGHRREEDTLRGKIAANWQLLLVAVLAALAGERALTEVARLLRMMLGGAAG